jgi:hypothetical protein
MVKKLPGVVDVPKRSHIDPVLRKYIWVDSQKKKYIKEKNQFKQITKYKGKYIVKKQKAGAVGDAVGDGVGDDAGGFATSDLKAQEVNKAIIAQTAPDDDDEVGLQNQPGNSLGIVNFDEKDDDADNSLLGRFKESKKTGIKAPADTSGSPKLTVYKKDTGRLVNHCNIYPS